LLFALLRKSDYVIRETERKVGMRTPRRIFSSVLTILSLAGISDTRAQGSSVGFHHFQSHHHAQSFDLPRLFEPAPNHVPKFTNDGLVRFWQQNEFSPILRNASIQMQLCDAVTARRDLNPTRFDHNHPLIGRLLREPAFFQYALHLYNTHQARFTFYHHRLIPLLRGCAMMMKPPTGTSPVTIGPPPGSTTVNPVPEEINNGPGTSPPPSDVVEVIPAPPSLVLMAIGMGYVVKRFRKRRVLSVG
jgi:hypothetical protein